MVQVVKRLPNGRQNRCTGDARNQGISIHGIDIIINEYSSLVNKMIIISVQKYKWLKRT